MVPDDIKIGDSIYITYFEIGIISKFTYIGDGCFNTFNGSVSLIDLSKVHYSLSEEQAKCKLFQYKLNLMQRELDSYTNKVMQTKKSIDNLHNEFGYLKNKFPEEFI